LILFYLASWAAAAGADLKTLPKFEQEIMLEPLPFSTTAQIPVLTLEEAVAATLRRSLALLDARQASRGAQGSLMTQNGSYDPTLTAAYSYNRIIQRQVVNGTAALPPAQDVRTPSMSAKLTQALPTGGSLSYEVKESGPETMPGKPAHGAVTTLTLQHSLLRGFGLTGSYSGVRTAREALESAKASERRALEQAVADVENAYWQVMQAQNQEEAAGLSVRAGDLLLARNRELEKRKLLAPFDVLTSESGEAQRMATYIETTRARRDAMEALVFTAFGEEAVRVLRAEGYEIRVTTVAPSLPALPSAEDAENQALLAREDLKAARHNLRQAEITEAAASRAALPDLGATGSIGGTGNWATGMPRDRQNALTRALRMSDPSWTLGLTLTLPLALRADRGRHLSALADEERKRLLVVSAENTVRQEVRGFYRSVRFNQMRTAQSRRALELELRQLEGERRRLDLGLSDSFRLLQVERDVTQQRLDLADAEADLLRALTGLRLATGQIGALYSR
jgi:outer membrane protein TolC